MKDEHDKVTAEIPETAHKVGYVWESQRTDENGVVHAGIPEENLNAEAVTGQRFKGSKTPDVYRQSWATPQWIIDFVAAHFGAISFDVCASDSNAKAERYYTEANDGLAEGNDWGDEGGLVWCNPPYADPLPWVEKAIQQAKDRNVTTIMLVNSDPSTEWFKRGLAGAQRLINIVGYHDAAGKFHNGRVAFVNAQTGKEGGKNSKSSVIFEIKPKRKGKVVTEYYSRPEMESIGAKLF